MRREPRDIRRLASELRAARAILDERDPKEIAGTLGRVAARLADPSDPLRREALERLPEESGLSPAMAEHVLDGMLRDWTADALRELLVREFGPSGRPELHDVGAGSDSRDPPRPDESGFDEPTHPDLVLTVGSGTVPGVTATSLLRCLLVRSPALVKPGAGDRVLSELWVRGIGEVDPELGRTAAVEYWPGAEDPELLTAALAGADVVVVYGSDRTVRALREAVDPAQRFVAYPHRVGFVAIGSDMLDSERARRLAHEVAMAVATFDQRGCVSPHGVYVEVGGEIGPAAFARLVADGLSVLEREFPPGPVGKSEAVQVGQWRGAQEMRAAADESVHYLSRPDEDWAVVYDPDPVFAPTCLRRSVWVRPVERLEEVVERVRPAGRFLQTVGLETERPDRPELEERLRATGATRICSVVDVPWPRAWWKHDGAGPLRVLVGLDPPPDAASGV